MHGDINESITDPRLVAFYLPQYHPIPENDEWWGKGFTEWTNTAKAVPLFKGHYQPHVPSELGFYDLRVPESRIEQAALAREYGIEAFCYYHYWFAGKRLLERPFSEVLQSGEPDFGFCLCWANQTWTGVWHGAPNRILIEQTYPGEDDHRRHFNHLLPAFEDNRYVRVDGKPLFLIYRPFDLPEPLRTTELWRKMASQAGLEGLHLVGVSGNSDWKPDDYGYDASVTSHLPSLRQWISWRNPLKRLFREYQLWRGLPTIYDYERLLPHLLDRKAFDFENYPCVIPNWDNTPRSGKNGLVLHNSTPQLFSRHFRDALSAASRLPDEHRFVFIKSWNEWAEGNHLEPDIKYGRAYLNVIAEELKRMQSNKT